MFLVFFYPTLPNDTLILHSSIVLFQKVIDKKHHDLRHHITFVVLQSLSSDQKLRWRWNLIGTLGLDI